jgi:hypothetical protein
MPLTMRTDLFKAIQTGMRGGMVILRDDLTPAQKREATSIVYAAYPPDGYGTARRQYGADEIIEWSSCE